ncbi:hypothetical protein [Actinomadura sp. 9N407]|uniref:hypothetical protein n=1 Tax=Actinomadura sp. 9N407 TaxID=3375154 RepID=UPI0037995477
MRNWTRNITRTVLVTAGIAMAGAGLGAGTTTAAADGPSTGPLPSMPIMPVAGTEPVEMLTGLLGQLGTPLAPGGRPVQAPAGTQAPTGAQPPAGAPAAGKPAATKPTTGKPVTGKPVTGKPPAKLPSTKRVGKAVPHPGPLTNDALSAFGLLGAAGLPDPSRLPEAQNLTQELTQGMPTAYQLPGADMLFTAPSSLRQTGGQARMAGPAPQPGDAIRTLLRSLGAPVHSPEAPGQDTGNDDVEGKPVSKADPGLGNLDGLTRGLPVRLTSSSLPS